MKVFGPRRHDQHSSMKRMARVHFVLLLSDFYYYYHYNRQHWKDRCLGHDDSTITPLRGEWQGYCTFILLVSGLLLLLPLQEVIGPLRLTLINDGSSLATLLPGIFGKLHAVRPLRADIPPVETIHSIRANLIHTLQGFLECSTGDLQNM